MYFKDDTIRLTRAVPELQLPEHAEGNVTRVLPVEDGSGVEAKFYTGAGAVSATLPSDAFELALSHVGGSTSVFLALGKPLAETIEPAMHAMLDHDFQMREGLNVIRLHYNREDRFWKQQERIADPTGAHVVTSAHSWDGCVVAFSGPERYLLEFRLHGRWQPFVLLHQRFETYAEQCRRTAPAMSFLRVLLNLRAALDAHCCAAPIAGNWLMDESWDSLLQEPYFPDLFLIPLSKVPSQLPVLFRACPMQNEQAILTALPVKFAPHDDPIERTERELKLNRLRVCKALGEKAYDQMYETSASASAMYSDAKDAYHDAIRLAEELELKEESTALSKRLEHIKAVFRNQFSR